PIRCLPAAGNLRRENPQRSQAERTPGGAAKQVRAGHQSQDRQSAWAHISTRASRHRRRGDRMSTRREFMALLGGAALAWPVAARGQQPAMPVVGFLTSLGQNERPNLRDAFRRGLSEVGLVEGRNVAIEYRFAEGHPDRLPALAADLVGRKVAVIAATGGGASVLAAKAATTTIPVVFTTAGDPVQQGFVASLNRPGGNLTGISWFGAQVSGKGLGFLHELIPNTAVVALLANPNLPESGRIISDAQEATRSFGQQLLVLVASTPREINAAFA